MNALIRMLVVAVALCSAVAVDARSHHHGNTQSSSQSGSQRNVPGQFDYYLLSLSWSPDYCSGHPNDTQQCGATRYGFVLHGLWPQYDNGYPSNCSDIAMPAAVKQQYAGLYPSDKLMAHEWPKHGTCSGLSPADYLALSKKLKDGVTIPARYQAPAQPFRVTIDALQHDFAQSNPGMPADAVTMSCSGSGRFLEEIHVCYDKDGGKARSCGNDVQKQMRKSCGQPDFLVKSLR